MEQQSINILHFEDNQGDAVLIGDILAEVKDVNFRIQHADRLSHGLQQLADRHTDIILLDLNLPDSRGFATFEKVKEAAGNVPILIMSGMADKGLALKAVQKGAQDYLLKGRVEADLLTRAIRYGIERQKLLTELQQALEQIKTLEGFLPICCYCKDIRDDRGFWHQIEHYIHKHSEAEFSHGICPKCAEKYHADLYRDSRGKSSKKKQ